MAQAEVGDLHLLLDTAQDNALFAPVKLECITGSKMQRDERLARRTPFSEGFTLRIQWAKGRV